LIHFLAAVKNHRQTFSKTPRRPSTRLCGVTKFHHNLLVPKFGRMRTFYQDRVRAVEKRAKIQAESFSSGVTSNFLLPMASTSFFNK
jgi:hypothetical protein